MDANSVVLSTYETQQGYFLCHRSKANYEAYLLISRLHSLSNEYSNDVDYSTQHLRTLKLISIILSLNTNPDNFRYFF